MIQQLEHMCGFTRDDTAESRLAKLEARLGDIAENDLGLIAELLLLPTGKRFRSCSGHRKRSASA